MMRNREFVLGLTLCIFLGAQIQKLNAQITIGSKIESVEGALLDMKQYNDTEALTGGRTADKGLGLPRVQLPNLKALTIGIGSDKTEISNTGTKWADHVGLLVYNVNENFDACDVTSIPSGLYV